MCFHVKHTLKYSKDPSGCSRSTATKNCLMCSSVNLKAQGVQCPDMDVFQVELQWKPLHSTGHAKPKPHASPKKASEQQESKRARRHKKWIEFSLLRRCIYIYICMYISIYNTWPSCRVLSFNQMAAEHSKYETKMESRKESSLRFGRTLNL